MTWTASIDESRWHLARHDGVEIVARCGHRLRGRLHGTRARPPEDERRSLCWTCVAVAGLNPNPLVTTRSRFAAALDVAEWSVQWPTTDPDAPDGVPTSPVSPSAA